MLIGNLLPQHPGIVYDVCNQLMTKKNISAMIDSVYRTCGQKETVIFCDKIHGARLLSCVPRRHFVRQG